MGRGSIDRLVGLLLTGNDWQRNQAAFALGVMGIAARKAAASLILALEDEDARVRWSAGVALMQVGWEGDPPQVLIDALHHGDPMLRVWALMALGGMASAPRWVIRTAVRLLRDPDGLVRVLAGEAFLRLVRSPAEVEDVLGRAFVDERDSVKLQAAEALWDAWPCSPRAAFAALALLSRIDEPEAHPGAIVLAEEISDRLAAGN